MKLIDDIRRENLLTIKRELGSVIALSNRLERSESQVSQWINGSFHSGTGKPRGMRSETARFIEEKCGKPTGWLDVRHDSSERNVSPGPDVHGTVPLISWVQAGNWREVLEADGDIMQIPTTYKTREHTFALRVEGDSMEPTFPRGCIIIVEPDEGPEPGQYVVVRQNGNEATFKQLIQDGGVYMLKPVNDRYPIMQMQQGAVFCGVVKQMMMEF